jgi:hypothetical protein
MLRRIDRWFSKPDAPPIAPVRIRLCTIWDASKSKTPRSEIVNLADPNRLSDLTRYFWNLCNAEARAVGESADAVNAFRRFVLNICNYRQGSDPCLGSSWLFCAGDESYPEEFPFVFICPTPDPNLSEVEAPPKPEGYTPNIHMFLRQRNNVDLCHCPC